MQSYVLQLASEVMLYGCIVQIAASFEGRADSVHFRSGFGQGKQSIASTLYVILAEGGDEKGEKKKKQERTKIKTKALNKERNAFKIKSKKLGDAMGVLNMTF